MTMMRLILPCLLAATAASSALAAKHVSVPAGVSATYRCADGRSIEILYSGTGDAVLTIGGETIAMRGAEAAGGVRYVGPGWQWWATGRTEGALSRLHDDAATAGTTCAAH